MKKNLELHRGTVVVALRHLDPGVADVHPGTRGVVFEPANAYGDNCGPMVCWLHPNGLSSMCNVYPGDVEVERRTRATVTSPTVNC